MHASDIALRLRRSGADVLRRCSQLDLSARASAVYICSRGSEFHALSRFHAHRYRSLRGARDAHPNQGTLCVSIMSYRRVTRAEKYDKRVFCQIRRVFISPISEPRGAGDAAGTVVASSSSSGTVTINGQTTTFGPSSPTTTTTKGPSGSTTTTHYSSSSPPPADECEHLRICEKCVNGWVRPDTLAAGGLFVTLSASARDSALRSADRSDCCVSLPVADRLRAHPLVVV